MCLYSKLIQLTLFTQSEIAQCYFTPVNENLKIIFSCTLSCLDIYFSDG